MTDIIETDPKCYKCSSKDLIVERRPNGNAKCAKCGWEGKYNLCFEETFEALRQKEKKWFYDRGFSESDMMYADAEFKKYLQVEQSMPDFRPFDKAPGFRRIFMMGYFYGKNK